MGRLSRSSPKSSSLSFMFFSFTHVFASCSSRLDIMIIVIVVVIAFHSVLITSSGCFCWLPFLLSMLFVLLLFLQTQLPMPPTSRAGSS